MNGIGKCFQLAWNEEVLPDSGTAQRSSITGEMKIVIPKLIQQPEPKAKLTKNKITDIKKTSNIVDYRNIVTKENVNNEGSKLAKKHMRRENDADFVDNSDVPPLL